MTGRAAGLIAGVFACALMCGGRDAPSRPECVIEEGQEDIHCYWNVSGPPALHNNYTLYWSDGYGTNLSRSSSGEAAVIHRHEYMREAELTAWVAAPGEAASEAWLFNTGHIKRPPAPHTLSHTAAPLGVSWHMICERLGPAHLQCQAQYRGDGDAYWTQEEGLQLTLQLEEPRPFTRYTLRVRCHCGFPEAVSSHWSSAYSLTTPPAAPQGRPDAWTDCGAASDTPSCHLYWKEMAASQARGEVTAYIVTLQYRNGSASRERRGSGAQGCAGLRRFPLPPGVVGVSVSAETSVGVSEAAPVTFPVRGAAGAVTLTVTGRNRSLWAWWQGRAPRAGQYVVQHRAVPPDDSCLAWVRVDGRRGSVELTGAFRNYTAYNVSLFAVDDAHSTFLASQLAYAVEGVPPEVRRFRARNISRSSVTLVWSSTPLQERGGVLLHHLIGLDGTGDPEVKVSAEDTRAHLSGLQPGRSYRAWVSAVSAAGAGGRSHTSFTTSEEPGHVTPVLLATLLALTSAAIIAAVIIVRFLCREQIPGPILSEFFQVWPPALCSPSQSTLKISELAIMEEPACHLTSTADGEEQEAEPVDTTSRRDYSEMVDTDDDDDDEEEEEDHAAVSDYERHFLPAVADV